jgi:hypothetical protein
MNAAFATIKKHPIVLAFHLIITSYCVWVTVNTWHFHDYIRQHPGISGVAEGGEGISFQSIGMFFVAGIFFLICGCLAIAYRAETKFYLWLALIAILQPIVFLQIGDIHSI